MFFQGHYIPTLVFHRIFFLKNQQNHVNWRDWNSIIGECSLKKPYSNSLSRPPKLILLFLKIYLFTPQNTSELYSGLGFNWSFNIRLNSRILNNVVTVVIIQNMCINKQGLRDKSHGSSKILKHVSLSCT